MPHHSACPTGAPSPATAQVRTDALSSDHDHQRQLMVKIADISLDPAGLT